MYVDGFEYHREIDELVNERIINSTGYEDALNMPELLILQRKVDRQPIE